MAEGCNWWQWCAVRLLPCAAAVVPQLRFLSRYGLVLKHWSFPGSVSLIRERR